MILFAILIVLLGLGSVVYMVTCILEAIIKRFV